MEQDNTPFTPTSLIFISLFWILIGTFIVSQSAGYFSITSYSQSNIFGIIPFMIGIVFIMVGWGLLTKRKWAYSISLLLSLIGTVLSFFINTLYLGSRIINNWEYLDFEELFMAFFPLSFFFLFVCMVGYLIKHKKYFETKP